MLTLQLVDATTNITAIAPRIVCRYRCLLPEWPVTWWNHLIVGCSSDCISVIFLWTCCLQVWHSIRCHWPHQCISLCSSLHIWAYLAGELCQGAVALLLRPCLMGICLPCWKGCLGNSPLLQDKRNSQWTPYYRQSTHGDCREGHCQRLCLHYRWEWHSSSPLRVTPGRSRVAFARTGLQWHMALGEPTEPALRQVTNFEDVICS